VTSDEDLDEMVERLRATIATVEAFVKSELTNTASIGA